MNLLRNSLLFISWMLCGSYSFSQEIVWTKFEALNDSMAISKKPILIKLETSWCGYCKMMDAKVFGNKKVIKKIKDEYYFIRLDAEGKTPIQFNGETYNFLMYSARSGVHQLAKKLGEVNGQMNYPTTVVLKADYSLNKKIVGYLNKNNFLYWLEAEDE